MSNKPGMNLGKFEGGLRGETAESARCSRSALTSPLPTAGFQPEQGVNSLLATLDSLARGLDNTNQLLHQERAYSKALLKENYDLKLKIIEYENKNSSLLDDILMGPVGQGAEGDSFGESQDQRGEKGLWQTVCPRRITRTANSNPNNANSNPNNTNPNPNNANEPYTSTRGTATAKKHKIKEGKTKQHTHNKQQPRGMENNQNKTSTFSKTSGTSRKPIQICMVGDSQLSRMDAQKMSNNHHVVMLNGKSGMKVEEAANRVDCEADVIIMHVGTNNLCDETPEEVAEKVVKTFKKIKQRNPKAQLAYSSIFRRKGNAAANGMNIKVFKTNKILKEELMLQGIDFIDNDNILYGNICDDGLHINQGGAKRFARNIKKYVEYW